MNAGGAPPSPARRALDLYAGEGLGVRLHVGVRWRSCPFGAVAAVVPESGRILEVGCGHGLFSSYLALASPGREVVGVDLDEGKIEVAGRAGARAAREGASVSFALGAEVPAGPWAAVVIVDVLYLLDRQAERRLLGDVVAQLAPTGVVVVKETGDRPWWKAAWTRGQEALAVQVLRITAGDRPSFTPPADLAADLERAGLTVESRRVDRGYPHPHHLLIGRQ